MPLETRLAQVCRRIWAPSYFWGDLISPALLLSGGRLHTEAQAGSLGREGQLGLTLDLLLTGSPSHRSPGPDRDTPQGHQPVVGMGVGVRSFPSREFLAEGGK